MGHDESVRSAPLLAPPRCQGAGGTGTHRTRHKRTLDRFTPGHAGTATPYTCGRLLPLRGQPKTQGTAGGEPRRGARGQARRMARGEEDGNVRIWSAAVADGTARARGRPVGGKAARATRVVSVETDGMEGVGATKRALSVRHPEARSATPLPRQGPPEDSREGAPTGAPALAVTTTYAQRFALFSSISEECGTSHGDGPLQHSLLRVPRLAPGWPACLRLPTLAASGRGTPALAPLRRRRATHTVPPQHRRRRPWNAS